MARLLKRTASVIGWSVASCALTLAVLLPANLGATSPEDGWNPEIARPTLVTDGVELTMRSADDGSVQINAMNTTDHAVVIHPTFECRSLGTSDPRSRVPRPGTVWTHDQSIALGPNEAKQIALPRTLRTNPGDSISVTSGGSKDPVVLLTFPRRLAN